MASQFETFVNVEMPKRISTEDNPLEVTKGKIPVSSGIGLQVEFKDAAEIVLKGKSAYDIAVDDGFVGTEEEWLESLAGKSAYEQWIEAGNIGSVSQFLESLIGEEGKSAYEVWQEIPGNDGKPVADFIAAIKGTRGEDGLSAYDIALVLGFVGDEEAWLKSLEGKMGQGLNILANISADELQDIIDAGDAVPGDGYIVGSYLHAFNGETWVKSNSLQGPKGQGLNYLGEWNSGVALPMDSNFVAGDTYVWKNSLWTLVEEPTRKWVDIGVPGPTGRSAYQVWLDAGNAGSEATFLASLKGDRGLQGARGTDGTNGRDGTNGKDGKSAYQLWLDAGNSGSNAEFLASLKGKQGDRGEQGDPAVAFTIKGRFTEVSQLPAEGIPTEAYYVKRDLYVWIDTAFENFGSLNGASAYETWVDQPANAGKTELEFLASLKGKDGTNGTNGRDGVDGIDGTNGTNLQVKGRRANLAAIQLIAAPADQDAYTADDTGHLHIFVTPDWIDAGKFRGVDGTNGTNGTDGVDGTNGESAYETWKNLPGNTGKSPADFIASIKGETGDAGKDGTNGTNGKSAYASWVEQPENVGKSEAEFAATLKGKAAYDTWLSLPGNAGKPESEFIASIKGERGTDGTNGTNGTNGKSAYESWLAAGNVGAESVFLTSLIGKSAYQTWLAKPGNSEKTEEDFIASLKGEKGDTGRHVKILGAVDTGTELPVDATEQDAYGVRDTNRLWMYIDGSWVDLGQFKGERGAQGVIGTSLNIMGEVDTDAELPDPSTLKQGDAWYSKESKKLYSVNEVGLYNTGITIVGEQGEQGKDGVQGPVGPAIAIQGMYPTAQALLAADPPQTAGHGYLVGSDLFLPSAPTITPKWFNAGPVRGPKGDQGDQGKIGNRGIAGPTGERGSLWLTLPAGVIEPTDDYGREGDWGVSETFDTFYKAPGTGWVAIGRLVAGDVNSPSSGLGKVVRHGKDWVRLPVDEVPSLVPGEVYARQLIAGNLKGEGEWVKITFPENFPEPQANGKVFGRTRAVGQTNGVWAEIVIPEGIKDLTSRDNKQYVRSFETADSAPKWKEVTIPAAGIEEAPVVPGTLYLRSGENKNWTLYTAGIAAPADNKRYMRTKDAWVAFNTYDVANVASPITSSTSWDASALQSVEITNTSGTTKAVSITNPPAAGRTMVLVAVIRGNSGVVTFTVGGQAVRWNGGTEPVFSPGFNIVTLFVIGGSTPVVLGGLGMQNDTLT